MVDPHNKIELDEGMISVLTKLKEMYLSMFGDIFCSR